MAVMAGGVAFMSLEDMKAELGLSESEYSRQVNAVGRPVPWTSAVVDHVAKPLSPPPSSNPNPNPNPHQLQDDRMHGGPKGGPDGSLEQRRKGALLRLCLASA